MNGVPQRVKSYNRPAFRSKAFADFANQFKFKHQKIEPLHPQSNATCERFMGPINKQMRLAKITGSNWKVNLERFLRDYRATPYSTTLLTPNELFGIEDSSIWPSKRDKLDPKQLHSIAEYNDRVKKSQSAAYANEYQATKENKLELGDVVLYKWNRVNKHNTPLDPNPYKIVKQKGVMITATRDNPSHTLTRDAGDFKKINKNLYKTKDNELVQFIPNPNFRLNIQSADMSEPDLIDFTEDQSNTNQPAQTLIEPNLRIEIRRQRGRPRRNENQKRLNTNQITQQSIYNLRSRRVH